MVFSDLYNAVTDQFGDTSAAMITRVKRFINWTQQDVASRKNWDWIMERSFIQCTAPYTTGTVTVTSGSATITGSGTTFTTDMVDRKIRFGTEDEFYTISALVSATEITLDQNYVGTTTAGLTYSIFEDEYSLSSDAEKVINMVNQQKAVRLAAISRQEFDAKYPVTNSYGSPESWVPAGRNNGIIRVQLNVIPDEAYIIYYWYRTKLSDLTNDSDTSIIPSKYHKLLYLGALAQAYEYDENPMANNMWTQYENMIDDMIQDLESGSEDSVPTMRSIDEYYKVGASDLRLPPEHFSN